VAAPALDRYAKALVDQEIANTLGELERKLHELERALTAMDSDDQRPEQRPGEDGASAAREPAGPSRLVDEAIERGATTPRAQTTQPDETTPRADTTQRDQALQHEEALHTASSLTAKVDRGTLAKPGSGAAAAGHTQPPSAGELLRFRERLERTARELTHDYDELLGRLSYPPVAPPSGPTISFARGAPSLDIVDVEGLRDAAVRAFESDPAGTTAYGTSVGYPRLRAWIADRHGVEPERVLVTNGSMQADAFLFEQLVRPGDEVIVERPTYDRTLLSLRQRGARLHAVELQPDGIDTEALTRLLAGGAGLLPKLAHIIPNFQNPAGYTLSLAKREALLALAARHGFIVFEDDPYVALRFRGESLPTMLSMDPDWVVYASSFSKTVCPGIRVGYLVGPPDVIATVAKLATNTYISPNMVSQSIVYEFCASGAIERSIETVRRALAERSRALANALRSELADAEFVEPEGGYFMWVTLPAGTDVHALQQAAAELGVSFVKGTDFVLEGGENTLRLSYAGVTPRRIEEGVTRLAAAYRSLA
jgi:DNA-binding transcriptional MocR family regulator